MNHVDFPWPPRELSPNSRTDRRHTTNIRRGYREACWGLTLASCMDNALTHVDITFHPPDARKRDLDNMLGAIKYGLDGMALALGVDDYNWSLSIRRGDKDPARKGYVRVMLTNIQ